MAHESCVCVCSSVRRVLLMCSGSSSDEGACRELPGGRLCAILHVSKTRFTLPFIFETLWERRYDIVS